MDDAEDSQDPEALAALGGVPGGRAPVDVENLLATQVTLHDHVTAMQLTSQPTAARHYMHGKRLLLVDSNPALVADVQAVLRVSGVAEPKVVGSGRECLKTVTVSRRNFEDSQLSADPAITAPVPCANFDFVFLSWSVADPECAEVIERLLNFGGGVAAAAAAAADGSVLDMNSRLHMPTIVITTTLPEAELPDVEWGLSRLYGGARPRWLNKDTKFPLLRLPANRAELESIMAQYDYMERQKRPLAREELLLPTDVATEVEATMADSEAGTIDDELYALRHKLRKSANRPTRITNDIREIQVAVEAADKAEEVRQCVLCRFVGVRVRCSVSCVCVYVCVLSGGGGGGGAAKRFNSVGRARAGRSCRPALPNPPSSPPPLPPLVLLSAFRLCQVFLEVDPDDDPSTRPGYRQQGNRNLYTAKALLRRKMIRLQPRVIHGIRLFWMALDNLKKYDDQPQTTSVVVAGDAAAVAGVGAAGTAGSTVADAATATKGGGGRGGAHSAADPPAAGSISREDFIAFNIKIQKALLPTFDLSEAVLIAEADWDRDMANQVASGLQHSAHPDVRKRRM
jgi:hypothetical protein